MSGGPNPVRTDEIGEATIARLLGAGDPRSRLLGRLFAEGHAQRLEGFVNDALKDGVEPAAIVTVLVRFFGDLLGSVIACTAGPEHHAEAVANTVEAFAEELERMTAAIAERERAS